ncbi:MAG TPA: 50S ribosomal protein L18 [Polyangiaceae bacterium LLY-WYZ-15_(1-7)]|mgnify:CR=1 FL=1|nr:50S ribosomal protein L18 [Sandaracinus sp.]HJK94312.1 50S ribosomal protein L18 [Polyangiaceae bacterium LLY-WYZ-15_(1-7)]MBJ74685.1 50S ribosomal protein L18 [Sandaracinus sp.]HJL00136.1 50S ribosomal protein L18 [Polyangiaceae bacterium LLY-WYZ-15_(1-7)]HJL08884.1 50S ribosomal protein L18 [Polyangiaceae bacterium LLY-WYZ-15_(1-7)]|tara:strand:- start:159 stop:509 length:351 start_codon:yes stop_codon:yes gene_type:complete
MNTSLTGRARRKRRIRKKVFGTPERPRLSVYRSAKHIYAQVIDDTSGRTLVSSSSRLKDFGAEGDKKSKAKAVGEALAKAALEKGIDKVVFDRNGYIYHGRVKALADGAREAGLSF